MNGRRWMSAACHTQSASVTLNTVTVVMITCGHRVLLAGLLLGCIPACRAHSDTRHANAEAGTYVVLTHLVGHPSSFDGMRRERGGSDLLV